LIFKFLINMWLLKQIYDVDYISIGFFIIFSFILGLVIFFLSYFIALQNPDSEKISAYECGFEPFEDARNKFDVRFYIVAILFIIFDIEVIFLFPWAVSFPYIGSEGFWIMIYFLLILVLGFLYEISVAALDWQ
jgi:NADH-quinone oxidoreductase subunit A